MLTDARRHGWSGTLQSCDRRKGIAERFGKSSQARLWYGWVHRLPGFNPANPPGRSTHERRSDGVAYRGPIGRVIAWWGTGMDVSESDELIRVLARLGYHARKPYSSASERHHVNLTADPTAVLKKRGLV